MNRAPTRWTEIGAKAEGMRGRGRRELEGNDMDRAGCQCDTRFTYGL
jgi:hypothetical protein